MGKILKIENDIISIGNDDGSLTEVRTGDCNFNPNVGDDVTIYQSDSKVICIKNTAPQSQPQQQQTSEIQEAIKNGGININVSNNQGSNNTMPMPSYEPYVNTGGAKVAVNKITYILLALLLGGLGIHKFYAGKSGQGFLYLIFCWTYIPGIIAFVEGIMACFQQEDASGRILV